MIWVLILKVASCIIILLVGDEGRVLARGIKWQFRCYLLDLSNQQVYIIGGDGTMRGAVKIFNEIRCRNLNVSVTWDP